MKIRPASQNDAHKLAELMLLAMQEIVFQFIGKNDREEALQFLHHFTALENNQYSYKNCFILEDEGLVLGMANLYDGASLHKLRSPIEDYIISTYQLPFHPEDETKAGEIYLDTLAVDTSQQGKGLGGKLLRFLIDEFQKKQDQCIGLLVEKDNYGAKKLYAKHGFAKVGEKSLVGKPMEHWQTQPNYSSFRLA